MCPSSTTWAPCGRCEAHAWGRVGSGNWDVFKPSLYAGAMLQVWRYIRAVSLWPSYFFGPLRGRRAAAVQPEQLQSDYFLGRDWGADRASNLLHVFPRYVSARQK